MKRSALLGAVLLASTAFAQSAFPQMPSAEPPSGKLNWLSWSDAVFSQAKHEQRFVLLDLEAVWCHWCHVMDVTTYLPNADVQYPSVPRAAAYVCTGRTCSAPIFKAEEVAGKVSRVLGLQGRTAAMVVPNVP